jgi:hypothetical protein
MSRTLDRFVIFFSRALFLPGAGGARVLPMESVAPTFLLLHIVASERGSAVRSLQ